MRPMGSIFACQVSTRRSNRYRCTLPNVGGLVRLFDRIIARRSFASQEIDVTSGRSLMNQFTMILVLAVAAYLSQSDDITEGIASSSVSCGQQVAMTNLQPDAQTGKAPMKSDDSSRLLTVARIFSAEEFQEEKLGLITWSKMG